MHLHLGIDVSKNKLDCALRLESGKYRNKVVENNLAGFNSLLEWLKKHTASDIHACMEATSVYWEAVAEYLTNQKIIVSVINPAQIKAFGASRLVRTKTDKADSQLIAEFCLDRKPEAWQAPSLSEQTLRALVLRLDALQAMQTQEKNRLAVSRDAIKVSVEQHLSWLEKEINALAKKIRDHINDDPDLRTKHDLLQSIPGIGERTTATLLSFYANVARFENARKAVAFAGLDPRQHQSGTSVKGKSRMSKVGHTFIRKALYMPAIVTLYKTTWGKSFYDRLRAAGKPNMVIIGAMMRKLIHVAFGVLRSGKNFDKALHSA
jgi:transposase